jgi:thymidylate kinase
MNEHLRDAIRAISKGDTGLAESFFRRPGGRRYLENISLILLNTLVPHSTEKEEMYLGFVQVLDHMEERILRQLEGEEILEEALQTPED